MKKLIFSILSMAMVFISIPCFAGNIDSPGSPSSGSGMYTLLHLYNYLNYGTVPTIVTSFQEPSGGPGSTMKTTKNIVDDAKAKFDQCDAQGSDVAVGKKFFSTQGSWGVQTGTGAISTGDAVAADVLSGKTFSNSSSAGLSGAMTNVGQQIITPTTSSQTISQGYHNGTGYVGGDAALETDNIRAGTTIFGVSGKTEVVDTTEATNSVVAGRMKTGDVGFVNGNKITGTGTQTLSDTSETVAEGYYAATTLSVVDTNLAAGNIKKDVEIFGVPGTYDVTTYQAGVAKTGQTICYDADGIVISCTGTGQDGDKLKGVAWPEPRFTDNTDGTVTDNLTGLIWLKNANCFGARNWTDALSYCNGLAHETCSLTDGSTAGDWRLPNVKELQSLIDFAFSSPALSDDAGTGQWTGATGSSFIGVQSESFLYWSSTTYATNPNGAWGVYMYTGSAGSDYKVASSYVWPVRSGS